MAATNGTDVAKLLWSLNGAAREQAILPLLLDPQSYPAWFWNFLPVNFQARDARNVTRNVTMYVSPDFLALGSATDWLRIPLWPATAQAVCDKFGCVLPTTFLADQIWDHSGARGSLSVPPQALPKPSPLMETTPAWVSNQILTQKALADLTPGSALVDGVKKNVVVGPNLNGQKVAIYGGRYPGGSLIQPYSTIHDASYSDYSHGIRLIEDNVTIDGASDKLSRIATDPVLWPLAIGTGRASDGSGGPFALTFPNVGGGTAKFGLGGDGASTDVLGAGSGPAAATTPVTALGGAQEVLPGVRPPPPLAEGERRLLPQYEALSVAGALATAIWYLRKL